MSSEMRENKPERLIDEFLDWQRLAVPAPSDKNLRRKAVEKWIEDQTRPHEDVALALMARLRPVLAEIEDELIHREGKRLVCRIDTSNLLKSPHRILDKMVRSWRDGSTGPDLCFNNFKLEMDDIARFRLVANFLSDVELIVDKVQTVWAQPTIPRTSDQQHLRDEFNLQRGRFEDRIKKKPEERTKGERCCQGVFYPRSGPQLKVEVQVQTLLQEAWDKKDHFLIYEPRRRGERIDPDHEREIFAMSELLYVADLTFDRLRARLIEERKQHGGDHATS